MELSHLLQLVSELPQNKTLNYVRGTDRCTFVGVDIDGERVFSIAPNGEDKSWAPSYLSELASKIFENEPFNLSGLLNNKGSYRPVLETIIAHTREFYTVRRGAATALAWIPSKPKANLELEEIAAEDIPEAKPHTSSSSVQILPPDELILKVKDSFLKYWEIIDQHGAQTKSYVQKFENEINPYLIKLDIGYKSVFQIIDIIQYNNIINRIASDFSELSFLRKGRSNHGDEYRIASTHVHYSNFLKIVALTDFRANLDKQQRSIFINRAINNSNYSRYLAAMRTKPFLLFAGISGTGKSRIVREMAFASCPPRCEMRIASRRETTA